MVAAAATEAVVGRQSGCLELLKLLEKLIATATTMTVTIIIERLAVILVRAVVLIYSDGEKSSYTTHRIRQVPSRDRSHR